MDLASSSWEKGPISPTTVRFRMLVNHFMAPGEEARLLGYRDGEVQLSLERPSKPPIFIVLIDGAREEERSLRLRIGRLTTEKVDNQHVVVVANHGWMPEALRNMGTEFASKVQLYQLNADGEIERKAAKPLPHLLRILKAQRKQPLPVAGVPVFTGGLSDSGLANESESEFAARCNRAEETKERLRGEYADFLKQRPTPITLAVIVMQAALFGLYRWKQTAADGTTPLVQLGALVPPFVREGEWWRLLSSAELHVGMIAGLLSLLMWLSLGTLLEKLLGSAQFLMLHVLSGLGAGLAAQFLPRASILTISAGASGTACGLFGAAAVLALDARGLPPAEAQRLGKTAIAGLVTTAILTFLPGVDRATHLGGVLAGVLLCGLGALRPTQLSADGRVSSSPLVFWVHTGIATGMGLILASAIALALWNGKPWQLDPSWKQRLGTKLYINKAAGALGAEAAHSRASATGQPGEQTPLNEVRRRLGESGASLELPQALGEAQEKAEPGRTPVYEFGDLGEKQQLLSVLVQRQPRRLKKKKQLEAALDQAVAQLRADRMRDGRVTVLTPPARSTVDGWPTMEFHIRPQETVQARGLVQARSTSLVLLWYVYTDLLPEAVQVDLKRALQSLRDSEEAAKPKGSKKKKQRR